MNSSWGYGKQSSFIYFGCWIVLMWMHSLNLIVSKCMLIDALVLSLSTILAIVESQPLDVIQSDTSGVICLN